MKKLHFLETKYGYQYLCSTAYDERDFKEWDIINEKVEEVDEKELNKLQTSAWQEVREMIKDKINWLIK